MKRVILTPNPYRDRSFRNVLEAKAHLESVGVETRLCLSFELDRSFELPKNLTFSKMEEELPQADAMICFGGDGTILHTSKAAARHGVPILGVNIGTVGFMAELECGEMSLLTRLANDEYTIDRRMMLDVTLLHEGETIYQDLALNDAVVTKGAVARVIQTSVLIGGVEAMNYTGDGLIAATPTGSTAYSMSAGGPIVEPNTENVILTPICAHNIQPRSLIVSPERCIELRVGRVTRRNAFLSVDGGKAARVYGGDLILLRMADTKTDLIRLKQTSFFDIVKTKLNH